MGTQQVFVLLPAALEGALDALVPNHKCLDLRLHLMQNGKVYAGVTPIKRAWKDMENSCKILGCIGS